MKVTGLKDMDSYIYSRVILPLKDLDIDGLSVSSPMTDENDKTFELQLRVEETGHVRYAHNFQRDEAQANAKTLVLLKHAGASHVVADYDHHKHNVRVYAPAFYELNAGMLMSKLIEAFNHYTPFTKVEIKKESRDIYALIPMEEIHD